MFADDRVRAGRVDEVDVAKPFDRRGYNAETVGTSGLTDGVAVLQYLDLRCGRCYALVQDRSSEEGIDERTLAGVELTYDHQQKELVELTDRCVQRVPVGRGDAQMGQGIAEAAE